MGSPSSEPGRYSDEGPPRRVTISRAFWMGKYEVTQGQWQAVMGSNPSHFRNCGTNCPLENVSWLEAVAFCNRLSEREGLRPAYRISGQSVTWDREANGYRLPTEAEWEYTARAGTDTPFAFGRCLSREDANCNGNHPLGGCPKVTYRQKTTPVGTLRANTWGFYDLHGNVWEWCWDWHGSYSSGTVTDPIGPSSGSSRVNRGGGWSSFARGCRSAVRNHYSPGLRYNYLGFRLARSVE